ncbi:DUF6810 family protein [Candidatus Lucifugimonas marina]|uniref:DUF6810 domain-containing protein n=1 Tax=Candidatus Lucifugimonas marina TaxID=3038979 RepID=A0AAJ5ZHS6_9CHLR|nr:hypothetical protein [SAR202 cluster bacterium JH702]MDG0868518.1 hypothetical protein [SAR202 cluster bacterium JH639]WFG35151.1 hypothetical protein GKN94_05395 [SAR202 cluster bacterium JH545]WFG39107.1 hypothetical protein GKO48_05560 [SAR202 cluster bacterium JH1073]
MSQVINIGSLAKLSRWMLLAMLLGALAMAMACGSGDDDSSSDEAAPAAEEADDELAEVSRILNPDSTYSVDDYIAAGWKQSKQYDDISTVPEATEVYFGFFSAKDIELRVYASHDSAKNAGVTDASEDIDQSFREGGQFGASNRGAGSVAVTKFKAFAVVGNTVMLCEQSIDACLALSDALGE